MDLWDALVPCTCKTRFYFRGNTVKTQGKECLKRGYYSQPSIESTPLKATGNQIHSLIDIYQVLTTCQILHKCWWSTDE